MRQFGLQPRTRPVALAWHGCDLLEHSEQSVLSRGRKARTMKTCLAGMLILVLAGCDAVPGAVDNLTSARLACEAWAGDDATIDTMTLALESGRVTGTTV